MKFCAIINYSAIMNFCLSFWLLVLSFFSYPLSFSSGLNLFLVETCVEYLKQPLALKEEGIFRVPGDTSTIRSLHADFMTSGQDEKKLKYN